MPCQIQDTFVDVSGNPQAGYSVSATPNFTPFFENFSGTWKEVKPGSMTVSTDVNGVWTVTLPFPSVSDPSTTKWIITLPDGTKWLGLVPEGIAGPVTVKTLKDSYGWALAAGASGAVVTAVAGPPGPAGAGILWRGAWSSVTAYSVGDGVSLSGSSYICVLANTNQSPPNATYWNVIAASGSASSDATTTTAGVGVIDLNPPSGHPIFVTREASRARSWLRI